MHSVSDLTTFSRKARGDVPPPLVGASTTVIDSQMYLFGGRLVAQRRMVADLYRFHLAEHTWERLPAPETDPNAPPPRYFHSADVWNGHLVIFGGMGYASTPNTPDDLCVLADVRLYSLADGCWLPAPPTPAPAMTLGPDSELDPMLASGFKSDLVPRARYAHLSAVSANHLYIIGGQDMTNAWLDDIHVFDLVARTWVARVPYPRHCGTYRSVAVCAPERVVNPPRVFANIDDAPGNQDELVELPFTADATPECPNNIYLYSNHNFTDVKRELQTLHPTPSIPDSPFSLTDASALLTGSSLPPGLRFPTGALLGTHLLIAGTYLAHTFQSYSLWALDLRTYTWSRIDPGTALSRGAWGRGVVWGAGGRFVVFGNREGNLVEDYNRRLLSWGDVAYVDLEAFGVYSPPRRMFAASTPPIPAPDAAINTSGEDPAQLSALAPVILGLKALHQHKLADFEVVADDGRRIKCSSAVLEARWGWFRRQRQLFRKRAQKIEAELARDGARGRSGSRGASGDRETSSVRDQDTGASDNDFADLDPRLSSRELHLSEPYAVTLALLQYFYTLTIATPLQHAPPVLSALLLIACTYTEEQSSDLQEAEESRPVDARPRQTNGNGNGHIHVHSPASSPFSGFSHISPSPQPRLPQFDALPHLTSLVRHAMHRALSTTNSVGVYEVATLCDCQSLQIRALKVVMASSKKQVHKQRQHGSGSGPSGRPRGMSDAPPPPPNGRPRTAEGTGHSSAGGNNIPAASPPARQKRLHTADGTRPRKPLVETYSHAPAGPVPSFGPVPKYSPPSEPTHNNDPFESVGRRGYRGLLDAVGDGIYSDDEHISDMRRAPPRSVSRGDGSRSDSRHELRLHSQSSHAALRETHARHRPALDEHGNPMGVDLERRKEQIVHRWSKRVSMIDSDEQQHLDRQHSRPDPELERSRSRPNEETSTSPSRAQRTLTISPSFNGGASLATVPSYSSASSGRPGSTSSGSASVRTPTDQTSQFHAQSRGHHSQGSETTLRPVAQETRRVMVGMSPYGAPIYREVRQDQEEPDSIPGLVGNQGKQKNKDKGTSSGKSEGGGGLGWLLSPQAKAEKAAAKVQAKMERRAREAAEREAAALEEAERRKNKEAMQQRIANIRNPGNEQQADELSKINAYQFAFVGNM